MIQSILKCENNSLIPTSSQRLHSKIAKLNKDVDNLKQKIDYSKEKKDIHIRIGIGENQPKKRLEAQKQTLHGLVKKIATLEKHCVNWKEKTIVRKLILTYTRKELREEGLIQELFFQRDDYENFGNQIAKEILEHHKLMIKDGREKILLNDVIRDLYQPKQGDL